LSKEIAMVGTVQLQAVPHAAIDLQTNLTFAQINGRQPDEANVALAAGGSTADFRQLME
jgi:hypothetical protein